MVVETRSVGPARVIQLAEESVIAENTRVKVFDPGYLPTLTNSQDTGADTGEYLGTGHRRLLKRQVVKKIIFAEHVTT